MALHGLQRGPVVNRELGDARCDGGLVSEVVSLVVRLGSDGGGVSGGVSVGFRF